jgi:ankyrin repeat protein
MHGLEALDRDTLLLPEPEPDDVQHVGGGAPLLLPRSRAAKAGDAQLLARLLGEGRDVNEADKTGWTALLWAAILGHVEVVRLLLARGGRVCNAKGPRSSFPTLRVHPPGLHSS